MIHDSAIHNHNHNHVTENVYVDKEQSRAEHSKARRDKLRGQTDVTVTSCSSRRELLFVILRIRESSAAGGSLFSCEGLSLIWRLHLLLADAG